MKIMKSGMKKRKLNDLESTYQYIKKYYPNLEIEKDTDYDSEQIIIEADYGACSITMYPDCWYISADNEQFGEAGYPETIEEFDSEMKRIGD